MCNFSDDYCEHEEKSQCLILEKIGNKSDSYANKDIKHISCRMSISTSMTLRHNLSHQTHFLN